MTKTEILIGKLLSEPDNLIKRKPYLRQVRQGDAGASPTTVSQGQTVSARIPCVKYQEVTEAQLMAELDPYSHKVLFDDNIPSITVKHSDGKGMLEIDYARMASPFQRLILDKQVLHACSAPMQFTLLNTDPSDRQKADFIRFKQGWNERNMDGHKTDFFRKSKSLGMAGCLFYFDYKGRCKARTLCFSDGYQICPHTDNNGDQILVSVYYRQHDIEFIDSYDDKYMYRYTNDTSPGATYRNGWRLHPPVEHGFPEIPIVTKSSKVAWDRVQNVIEVYEVNNNIFSVCQKRYGWGILYVKGQFNPTAKRIAGSIVLNDTSLDPNADAKFLQSPDSANMIGYLEYMERLIQLGSGTTFILPKDIKISGDTSGLAIQLTQELDMETARNNIREWQNAASKMARLFKAGYAAEIVANNQQPTAITDFESMNIDAKFQVWRPQSDTDYVQMLSVLHSGGGISQQTFIEKNPASTPDEMARISRETEIAEQKAMQQSQTTQQQ